MGDFAPSFAHASRTSQVQNVCFCTYHLHVISFKVPAESAKMQKLHLCTFANSVCANHAILFLPMPAIATESAKMHLCIFAYSTCAIHTTLALPMPMPAVPAESAKMQMHFCICCVCQPPHLCLAHASCTRKNGKVQTLCSCMF